MAKSRTKAKEQPLPLGWASDQYAERQAALDTLPHRVRVLLAAEWARSVLPIFEKERPGDARPLNAIQAAEMCSFDPNEKNRNAASAASAASASAAYASAYAADAYAASAASAAADAADAYAASTAYAAAADARKTEREQQRQDIIVAFPPLALAVKAA